MWGFSWDALDAVSVIRYIVSPIALNKLVRTHTHLEYRLELTVSLKIRQPTATLPCIRSHYHACVRACVCAHTHTHVHV